MSELPADLPDFIPTYKEVAAAKAQLEDQNEALYIDFFRRSLERDNHAGIIAISAFEMADRLLASKVPHADVFGYPVARDAQRWLDYRTAYLFDKYPADKQNLSTHAALQEDIDNENPLYFGFYAWLERRHRAWDIAGEPVENPIEIESLHAAAILLNILDVSLDTNKSQLTDPHRDVSAIEYEDGNDSSMIADITRYPYESAELTHYTLSVSRLDVDNSGQQGVKVFLRSYDFDEAPQRIDVKGRSAWGTPPTNTKNLLFMASQLSLNKQFVFERRGLAL